LRDPRLGRALALIHRQPEVGWTVAQLASAAGMSRSAFAAQFSSQVGQTPLNYLTDWRMQIARDRLMTTRDSVEQVAADCGYGSEAAFCRAFRHFFGFTPGAARKGAGGEEAQRGLSKTSTVRPG
jgi:AraC-like DNA-binding protein